ncbi:MAG: chromosome segregation protein SMC [Candidatus Hodarchaeota archaeon]
MAFIRQITIQGFKSFSPRKTTINLTQGFTAIVGENGCGKSNILDAVCFVLGRLSSKSLRAENFASLLFNGGAGNSPAKICRVSLVFTNTDRQLPIDADEVTISREVDESGVSAYRIGGKRVTRTEMLDTISVAGLHPEGHNIVLQNELANVISMSPTDIRQVVEGVAGISVFDEKKQQIEGELSKVDQNLQIVQMRTEEIRQEYSRLEKDRQDALRWREITEQIVGFERDLVFAELIRLEQRLNELKEEYATYSKNIKEFEAQRQAAMDRRLELEEAVHNDGVQIKTLDQQLHSNEIEITRLREILRGLQLTSDKINRRAETLSASVQHLESQNIEKETALSALDENINELKAVEATLKEQISPLRTRLTELSGQIPSPDAEYVTLRDRISSLTERIETKKGELGESLALQRISDKEITEIKKQIDESYAVLPEQERTLQEAKTELQSIEKELKLIESEQAALQEQQNKLQSSVQEKQKTQDELTLLIQAAKEELLEAQTRLKTIQEFKKYGLTRKAAIEAVLKFAKENKIPGVYGTLGSLGQTSTKHAIALDVAGGGRLDFIVVDNENTATKCIDHLKKSRIGRATFIPLNSIKADPFRYKEKQKGVIGNAMELLNFNEQFRPAFEYVFGRTLIVKDLETAREIPASGVRKITIDGDVVEPNRTITGGYYKGVSSLTLEEEARIPELQKKLKELQNLQKKTDQEYREWKEQYENLGVQIREKETTMEKLRVGREQASDVVTEQEEALQIFKDSIAKLHASLKGQDEAKNLLEKKIQSIQTEMNDLTQQRERIQKELSDLERSSLDPNLTNLRSQLDELENQFRDVQVELTEKSGESKITTIEFNRISKDLENTKSELEQTQQELVLNQKEIQRIQLELASLESINSGLEEKIQNLETEISSNEAEAQRLNTQIDEFFDTINEEKMNQSRTEGRIEHWEERIAAQKEKTRDFEPPPIPVDPAMVHSIRRQLADLQQEREQLGLVNQKAVERFEEIRHAYDEILEKERRIREEREAILDAMRRAEEEKFRVFMAAFSSISHNFSDVYQKLTQGEGQLELENPENPFLGGIRMRVRPAGKRIQYLDALSGGEKALTALTFMFALQLHQPAPFYFLDEIDEALDPNNADRVAKLIENLSRNSQFIIISHNEITIRLANTLLGVAMADGVSRVFSVTFEEGQLLIDGKATA